VRKITFFDQNIKEKHISKLIYSFATYNFARMIELIINISLKVNRGRL